MRFFAIVTATLAAVVAAAPTPALPLIGQVNGALDQLGLTVHNTLGELVAAVGLSETDAKLTEILKEEVQIVDNVLNGLDKVVDGLLVDLGEEDVVTLLTTLEGELGLSPTNTIGELLEALHIL